MHIFVTRSVANQPKVQITGSSVDHILSSRFFRSYDHDGKFLVYEEQGNVMLKNLSTDESDLIGWIAES